VIGVTVDPSPFFKTVGEDWEEKDFDVYSCASDSNLNLILEQYAPQVIVTIGNIDDFKELMSATFEVRRHWLHFESLETVNPDAVYWCYVLSSIPIAEPDAPPLVSVFTPVYNTGTQKLLRAYESLKSQTWTNWEWVIVNDYSEDSDTQETIQEIITDYRVRYVNMNDPCGRIGELKAHACRNSNGSILVELDHDDMLTPNCLFDIVNAFREFPEAGFAYTDWAERYESHDGCHSYGDHYGFGFGSAVLQEHPDYENPEITQKREYLVQIAAPINPKTIRHIVGMPNHVRAFRKSVYQQIGGYSKLNVADDYELMVRMFLATRMVHIPRLGYIQFYNDNSIGNSQKTRNAEIQRAVKYIAVNYEDAIHARLTELGIEDYACSNVKPASEEQANLTSTLSD
jgi:glycosyltransferase involved in cell wall biosynthesis